MTEIIHQPHDKLFKSSLEDIRVARDFFKSHLPPNILKMVDLKTLRLQKNEHVNKLFQGRETDVVYQVLMQGKVAYFYLLCELQSDVDPLMAFRLLNYQFLLMEMHLNQHASKKRLDVELPIVYPMLIYAGEKPWTAKRNLFDLFGKQKKLAEELFSQPYQLIDLCRISDEALRQQLWSGVFEFALKYREARDLAQFFKTLFRWLDELEIENGVGYGKILLQYVINGLGVEDEALFVQQAHEHLSTKLQGEAMTLAQCFEERGRREGRQEGIQKGIQQGEQAILSRLLQRKFGVVPRAYREKIEAANLDALSLWCDAILEAQTLEEVFAQPVI